MRFDSQLSRMNCQTFSTGLSSGHLAGSGSRVRLAGTTSPAERCQLACPLAYTEYGVSDGKFTERSFQFLRLMLHEVTAFGSGR